MKVIFMGTPEFALPTLEKIVEKHEVIAVYSQPPRPSGRGKKETPSVIHAFANERNIPVFTPVSLKSPEEQTRFSALNADIAVVVAYGLLLPKPILSGTKYGCLNIHPSLLPRWRGAAPIQRAIMAGDTETGVCIMQMDEGMDTGAVLMQENFDIADDATAGDLHDELSVRGAELLLKTLAELGKIVPIPQTDIGFTYAKKITKEEAKIDWNLPATEIANMVRGLNPYPCAYFMDAGNKIKLYKVKVVDIQQDKPAGSVLDDKLLIACGEGAIRILELQRAGKRIMNAEEFTRGYEIQSPINYS